MAPERPVNHGLQACDSAPLVPARSLVTLRGAKGRGDDWLREMSGQPLIRSKWIFFFFSKDKLLGS